MSTLLPVEVDGWHLVDDDFYFAAAPPSPPPSTITPPVFSNKSQCSDFTVSNATRTTLATTAIGDMVIVGLVAESNSTAFATPTGHSLTYTNAVSRSVLNRGSARVYTSSLETAAATAWNVSETVSIALTNWGLGALVLSNTSGIGATNAADFNAAGTLGQLSLTTTQDHSAIVWLMTDWQAADHSTRVYQTINGFTPAVGGTGEVFGVRTIGQYSGYMAYWPDVGLAGTYTVGTTTEQFNGGFVMCALEIKGTATSSAAVPRSPRPIVIGRDIAAARAANW